MPTLAETQRLLWSLITAPEGVGAALCQSAAGDRSLEQALARTVRGDPRLGARARLDIYANMYFYRLLDVLKQDYPGVLAVAGDVGFHNLITDYLLHHFPTQPSLRHAGQHLPAFLGRHGVAESAPFVSELAAFEWALVDAFDARDAPVLAASALAPIPPARWAALRFRLHPSVQLLRFGWPVHRLRQRVDRGEKPGPLAPAPTSVCVWRKEFRAVHREVGGAERCALEVVSAGGTFAQACAMLAGVTGVADAPPRMAATLAQWLAEGMLTGFEFGG